MEQKNRKFNRLQNYDYSQNGAYFLTICVENRKCLLSRIVGGGVLDAPMVQLSDYGYVVERQIKTMNDIYSDIKTIKYTIMPNHVHLLVVISNEMGMTEMQSSANSRIAQYISTLKRYCNKEYGRNIWQRSYYDHIIRDDEDYQIRWNYIDTNPARWENDRFYTT